MYNSKKKQKSVYKSKHENAKPYVREKNVNYKYYLNNV